MSKDPLLPTFAGATSTATASPPPSRRHFLSFPPLLPLPEHDELPLPFSPSSLKDRIIFGPSPSPSDPLFETLTLTLIPPSPPPSPIPISNPPINTPTPVIFPISPPSNHPLPSDHHSSPNPSPIVRNAFVLLSAYLLFGVLAYSLNRSNFIASETHPVVDALYFCIVTMCTIGYGDITPSSPTSKLFSIAFVLIGFGFIDILLSAMLSYVLDTQEHHLLDAAKHRAQPSYVVDLKKGRMRIRLKVALALGVVVLCICVGVGFLRLVERLSWLDAFYLSVMSVTTVGYGDRAFTTMGGRIFACVWLLVSTLAVARAFLYLVEARMDKRHREMAKWVLARNLTAAEFLEADMDNNGFVR